MAGIPRRPIRLPTSLVLVLWSAVTLGAAVSAAREGWWMPPAAPAQALLQPMRAPGPQVDATGNRYRTRTDW